MASSNDVNGSRVVLISGLNHQDLQPAALLISYFLRIGFQIQSTNLHDTNFLYTLIHPTGSTIQSMTSDYLEILKKVKRSTVFSVAVQ
jgi:hypothetical protein